MRSTLLRSGLWYLTKWGMNPVFCNVFKKPLHDWSHLHGASVEGGEVVRTYESVVRGGGKPAGVALLPSSTSRVVVLDLDIYRVNFGMGGSEVASLLADHGFVAAVTPRGGVRIAASLADGEPLPGRVTVYWFGQPIGEGSGSHKHLWHFPPSVACVETSADGRCARVGRYEFVLPGGKRIRYPWELGVDRPPSWRWSELTELMRAVLQVEISEEQLVVGGDLKPSPSSGARVPVPCWRDLREFEEWLMGLSPPAVPLPACVARALGYAVTEDLRNAYTGEKVPHGLRYVLGAAATMFLAATVASSSVEEIVEYVGRNLEGFPADEGEPLNTKLSRLLAVYGSFVVPRYSGLGSLAASLPVGMCESCPYSSVCRTSPSGLSRYVPWLAFSTHFWEVALSDGVVKPPGGPSRRKIF